MTRIDNVLFFAVFVFAAASGGESDASTTWSPGADRFQGTFAEGVSNLVQEGAPRQPMMYLWGALVRHQMGAPAAGDTCVDRFVLPREHYALMASGHGVQHDLAAPDEWPEDLNPLETDCWDSRGHHLLMPHVCRQPAYETPSGVSLPPAGVVVIPGYAESGQWVGGFVPSFGNVVGGVAGAAGVARPATTAVDEPWAAPIFGLAIAFIVFLAIKRA